MDDVMPSRDGPENLRILKRPLKVTVEFFESLPAEILNTTRCATHGGDGEWVSILSLALAFMICVSVFLSPRTETRN